MSKRYNVLVSPRAYTLLSENVSFLANINEKAARALVAEFSRIAKSLSENPERCPYIADDHLPHSKYRKLLFYKRYLALFQIIEDTVFIDFVIDCCQNYSWLIVEDQTSP